MNMYKVIHVQDKSTRSTNSSDCVGGGHGNFTSAKKRSTCGKYLNTIFDSVVVKVKKTIEAQMLN